MSHSVTRSNSETLAKAQHLRALRARKRGVSKTVASFDRVEVRHRTVPALTCRFLTRSSGACLAGPCIQRSFYPDLYFTAGALDGHLHNEFDGKTQVSLADGRSQGGSADGCSQGGSGALSRCQTVRCPDDPPNRQLATGI